MNCKNFEGLIPEFLDDFLDPETRSEMEAHRDSCPGCAQLLKLHTYIVAALDTAEPVSAPSGLADRILAAAAAEDAVVQPKLARYRTLLPVAAAFIFVAGAFFQLGSFVNRIPGFGGVTESWPCLFEWPLLAKAWLLGFLGNQWAQKLMEPVYFPAFSLAVPLYFFVGYGVMLGFLVWYAGRFFHATAPSGGFALSPSPRRRP